MKLHKLLRPLFILLAIAALIYGSRLIGLDEHLSVDGMRRLLDAYGSLAPLVFIAVCIAGILLHMPEGVLIAIGGILFGPVQAFAYGWVAVMIGTTAVFLLVRYVARSWVQGALFERFNRFRRLDDRLATDGFKIVVVLRVLLFLTPPLNWAMGTTSVSLRSYVAGTAVGIVPGIASVVYFAGSIAAAATWEELLTAELLIPGIVMLVVLVAAGLAGRRVLARA